jgi:hypothetical protein
MYFDRTTSAEKIGLVVMGAEPLSVSVDGISVDGKIQGSASTTGRATLNIPHGAAPTSPVNGDMWTTSAGLFVRINGATVGPVGTSGITGSGVANRVTYWSGTSAITSSANLTFDGTDFAHGGTGTFVTGTGQVSLNGAVVAAGAVTVSGLLLTAASGTGAAGFRLPHGAAPTSPVDGDVWTTTAGVFARVNGVTLNLGAGTITGSGSANQVTYWSGGTAITGSANLTFDGTDFAHGGSGTFSTGTGAVSLNGATTVSGLLLTTASGTGSAGFRLPHGAAPTSPVNGDVWTTTAGVFARVNGVTLNLGAGTITGSGVANQVTYWSGTSAIAGSANLTFDGTDFAHGGTGTFATGTGAVSLNGNTTIPTGKTLTVTDQAVNRLWFSGVGGLLSSSSNLYFDSTNSNFVHNQGAGTLPSISGHQGIFARTASGQNAVVGIIASDTGASALNFGDTSASNAGAVRYDHNTDTLALRTSGATDRLTVVSTGVTITGSLAFTTGTGAVTVNGALGVVAGKITTLNDTTDGGSGTGALVVAGGISFGSSKTSYGGSWVLQNALVVSTSATMHTFQGGGSFGGGFTGSVYVSGTTATTSSLALSRWSNGNTGNYFGFGKSRGAAVGTHVVVQQNDAIGFLSFDGSDGAAFKEAAFIGAFIDSATISSTSMPGRVVIATSAVGAVLPTVRLTIDSAGLATFANAVTVTGLLLTAASATGSAGFRLPHGSAPSSPVNGDIWTTTSGVFARVNGATLQLDNTGTVSGSGVADQITYWNGTSTVTGSANLTFDGTTLTATQKMVLGASYTTAGTAAFGATSTIAGDHGILVRNLSAGTTSYTYALVRNDIPVNIAMTAYSSGYTGTLFGIVAANYMAMTAYGSSLAGLFIGTQAVDKPIIFGQNTSERARFAVGGNLLIGSATDDGVNKLQITGGTSIAGNFAQSGATTFATGTGAISLNGAVTAASTAAITTRGGVGASGVAASVAWHVSTPSDLSGTTQRGVMVNGFTFTSAATVAGYALQVLNLATAAAVFTAPEVGGLLIGLIAAGSGSTITRVSGVRVTAQTAGGTGNAGYAYGTATFTGTFAWHNSTSDAENHGTGTNTFGGLVQTVASTTATAGLNLPHGAAPTSPVNGDIWTTTAGVFARVNGVTIQLDLTGTVTGSGIANQITYWSGTSTLTSGTSMVLNGTIFDAIELRSGLNNANSTSAVITLYAKNASSASVRSTLTQDHTTGVLAFNCDVGINGTARGFSWSTAGTSRLTMDSSGHLAQVGATNFASGTGTVTLNGSTTVVSGKTLTVTDLTAGSVIFSGTAGLLSVGNLLWDQTNLRLGVSGASGTNRDFNGLTAGARRWTWRLGNSTSESGANAGSDLNLLAFDDSAVTIDTPITITRAAGGTILFVRPISQTGSVTFSTGTGAVSLNGAVTAASTLLVSGRVGVGALASLAALQITNPTGLSGTTQVGLYVSGFSATTAATANVRGAQIYVDLAASTTTSTLAGILIQSPTLQSGATATSAAALHLQAVTIGTTNNYNLYIGASLAGITGSWNICANVTTNNYLGSGATLVGTATALASVTSLDGAVTPQLQVVGTGSTGALLISRNQANAFGANLILTKSRNATPGSFTIVQASDVLGVVNFTGDDGVVQRIGATIFATVDGTPGSASMPGKLSFATTPTGATAATTRLTIDAIGQIAGTATTETTSSATGALVLAGGAGIAKSLTVGLSFTAIGGGFDTAPVLHIANGTLTTPTTGNYSYAKFAFLTASSRSGRTGKIIFQGRRDTDTGAEMTSIGARFEMDFTYQGTGTGAAGYVVVTQKTLAGPTVGQFDVGMAVDNTTGELYAYLTRVSGATALVWTVAIHGASYNGWNYTVTNNTTVPTWTTGVIGTTTSETFDWGFTGNITQTGASKTFTTGGGLVTLNGNTIVEATKRFGMGTTSTSAAVNVDTSFNGLSGSSQYAFFGQIVGTSASTNRVVAFQGQATTAAASFTCSDLVQFASAQPITAGAGSTVTRSATFHSRTQTTAGTANFGWYHGSTTSMTGSGTWAYYNGSTSDANFLGAGVTIYGSPTSVAFTSGASAVTPGLQGNDTAAANSGLGLSRWTAGANSGNIFFGKSRGAAVGTFTVVQTSDQLGNITFNGADGTVFREAATIRAIVDTGTISSSSMPGRLIFSTTVNGAVTATDRLFLMASGELIKGSTATLVSGSHVASAVVPHFQLNGTTLDSSNQIITKFANDSAGPALILGKARGASVGTYTAVSLGDTIGRIIANAADGTVMRDAARIEFAVSASGTISSSSMPGEIRFYTTPDTTVIPVLALTLAQDKSATFTGLLTTVASATGSAGLNLPHGAAPSSPVNGDVWTTTAGVFARVNGTTVQLDNSSTTVTGSGVANQVTYWNGTNTVVGSTALTYNGSNNLTLGANATATANLVINGTVSYRVLRFNTAGSIRWDVATTSLAESGANAGSNFGISSYDDTGTLIATWMSITRSSGAMTYTGDISQTGAKTFSTGTGQVSINGNMVFADKLLGWGAVSSGALINIPSGVLALTGTSQYVALISFAGDSTATTRIMGIRSEVTTKAASFTCTDVVQFGTLNALTAGAASTVTRSATFYSRVQTIGGTANIAYYTGTGTAITGTGSWNIYNDSSTANYLGTGATLINQTADDATNKLQVTGGSTFAGNLTMTGAASLLTATAYAPTVTSGSDFLANWKVTANPASSSSATYFGHNTTVETNSACSQNLTATFGMVGMLGTVNHFGSGTLTAGIGVRGVVNARVSGGIITSAYAFSAVVQNLSATAMAQGANLNGEAATNTGGGTITRLVGILQARQTVGTNNYGFYYGALAGTGNWGFYNATADNNYLGTGNTLINTTTDDGSNKFQVSGSTRCTGTATGGAFAISGAMTIEAATSAATNDVSFHLYRTDGAGSGDFAAAGHLIIQPRTSTANARDVIIYTGATTGVERFRVGSTGTTTVTGLLQTTASATGSAGINLPHGAAPSSPVNGDVWTTTAGVFARVNGATIQLDLPGTVTGTGSSGQMAYWSGTSTLTSSANWSVFGTSFFGIATASNASVQLSAVNSATGGTTTTADITAADSAGRTAAMTAYNGVNTATIGGTAAAASVSIGGTGGVANIFYGCIDGVNSPTTHFVMGGTTVARYVTASWTFLKTVNLIAGTTGTASVNVPHGVAPSSPVNGDMWSTTLGFYVRVNGATFQLSTGGTIGGGISAGQVAYGSGVNAIVGSSTLVHDGTYTSLTGTVSTSAFLALPASTTSVSSLRVPHGVKPTAPVDGDIWSTTLGMFAQVNGLSQPLTNNLVTSVYQPGNYTLTSGDTYVEYTGTGGHTWTLPAANVATTHSVILFVKNNGTGTVTIACAGADTIAGSTTIQLLAGQARILIANKVSSWSVN